MIERSPFFDFITYVAMAFGAFLVVIPFWITLVAGSQSLQEVSQVPISLLPSSHLFENLASAWTRGDLGPKLINSLIVAVGVTVGEQLRFDIDGHLTAIMENRNRASSWYVLLNMAMGGSWPGSPNTTTVFPCDMILDWIRFYEPLQ